MSLFLWRFSVTTSHHLTQRSLNRQLANNYEIDWRIKRLIVEQTLQLRILCLYGTQSIPKSILNVANTHQNPKHKAQYQNCSLNETKLQYFYGIYANSAALCCAWLWLDIVRLQSHLSWYSLAPRRLELNLKYVIFKPILMTGGFRETVFRRLSLYLTEDTSILVQAMVRCRQATNHYLRQCWSSSMLPYDVN